MNHKCHKAKGLLMVVEQVPDDGIAAAAVEQKLEALVEEQAYNHWKELWAH